MPLGRDGADLGAADSCFGAGGVLLAAAAAFSLSSCSLDLRLCMTASRLCPCHASATCHNSTPENLSLMQLADLCASTWLTALKLCSQFSAAQQWQCHLLTTHAFTVVDVEQPCDGYPCVSKASRQPVQPTATDRHLPCHVPSQHTSSSCGL